MKFLSRYLIATLIFSQIATPVWARQQNRNREFSHPQTIMGTETNTQMLIGNIETKIYSVKKNSKFIAVEIGFTNNTNEYIEFTPKEIYLNSSDTYSMQPLSKHDAITAITSYKNPARIIPMALTLGLGIAALGATRGSNGDAAFGLGMAALSVGAVYALSESLHNTQEQNKLVAIENNPLNEIKRLPPGITLGGFLYFPAVKKPTTLTIVARSKKSGYQKIDFDLGQVKASKKTKKGRS